MNSTISKSSTHKSIDQLFEKPKALDYLNKARGEKESVNDYISISRQILMSKISINLKHGENQRLKEYITMEQEKLAEAQKFLKDDKEKFDVLMNDTEKGSKSAQDEAKAMALKKQQLLKKIDDY